MTEVSMRRDVPEGTPPTLTVAAVARRLGIAPATLRTWDRRYGLGPSQHTAGSHRRYLPEDVARLLVMRRLTLDGVAPAEAAALALGTDAKDLPETRPVGVTPLAPGARPVHDPSPWAAGEGVGGGGHGGQVASGHDAGGRDRATGDTVVRRPGGAPPRSGNGPAGSGNATSVSPAPTATDEDADPSGARVSDGLARLTAVETPRSGGEAGRAGGGRVIALPGASPAVRGLARAAMALDSQECSRIVHEHLAGHGTVRAWEQLVSPVLVAIGERWEATGEAVEVEHLLTECVMSNMRAVTAALRHARNARPVLLAAAEDELHGLPIHVLGAALAERGVASRMLGVRVPRTALSAAVQRTGPAAVLVHAQLRVADPSQLEALPRLRPAPLLLLGGPGWEGVPVPPGAERVRQLDQATERVLRAVGL